MTVDTRSPQENAVLILRAQRDAAELLRRADREQQCGAVSILLPLEEVRRIAGNITDVAALKEREHVELYRGPLRG